MRTVVICPESVCHEEDMEIEILFHWSGKHRAATLVDPEEWPEPEIDKVSRLDGKPLTKEMDKWIETSDDVTEAINGASADEPDEEEPSEEDMDRVREHMRLLSPG